MQRSFSAFWTILDMVVIQENVVILGKEVSITLVLLGSDMLMRGQLFRRYESYQPFLYYPETHESKITQHILSLLVE